MNARIHTLSLTILAMMLSISISFAQRSETRDLQSFDAISVGESIDVYLKEGTSESARIEVSGLELDEVLTEVKGNRLKIHLEDNNYRNIDVEVWVTYRNLESIEVSSAASISTDGTLKASSLRIEASSAGDTDLELDVDELRVEVSSSADVEVSGRAGRMDVSVSSAGDFKGYDLVCEEAEVSASSAGSARVNVTKRIDASANSAGSVRFKGNPDKVYETENSGGSVKSSN